jgi:hypothetical protein
VRDEVKIIVAKKQTRSRHHSFSEPAFSAHVKAIGQLALAWNDLHEKLALLFIRVMGMSTGDRSLAIWNSVKVDRPKREFLLASAKNCPEEQSKQFPKLVSDIEWICAKATELEDLRNNSVHAPLMLYPLSIIEMLMNKDVSRSVIPNVQLSNFRAKQLSKKAETEQGLQLVEEFRWCRDCTLILRDFSAAVELAILRPNRPWPNRPSWPTRQQAKKRSDTSRKRVAK